MNDQRPIVILESPYRAPADENFDAQISIRARNVKYARAALRDCIERGEAPLASHLLYTQPGVLRDNVPHERTLGIEVGLSLGRVAQKTVVYQDLGVSHGMELGIERALREGREVEFRNLPGWVEP